MNTKNKGTTTYRNGFSPRNKFSANKRISKINNRNRINRPNRRQFPKIKRNRLQRVQNIIRYNNNYQNSRFRRNFYQKRNTNAISNINNAKREVFVKGLPRFVDNKGLFNLFKGDGRISQCKILYDNIGFSRGIGKIEFVDFRDAWRTIKKWNNSVYKGFTLKLEYKKMKNEKSQQNALTNPAQFRNNNNYGKISSNYRQFNGYFRNLNGNLYNYNNYGYNRYKY